jgi:ABC-type dipeptide/oligopeptide/nickel transport system permease subunit
MSNQEPGGGSAAMQEFAAEGLRFRTDPLYTRIFRGSISFIRGKPLGAFGVFIVLVWTLFAVGTVGDGGGWLGVGRYNSLEVFKIASTNFADNKAANAMAGQPADLSNAAIVALFATDTEWLGPLASDAGVDGELQLYIVGLAVEGMLITQLEVLSEPPLLERTGGEYVKIDDIFSTGTATPTTTDSLADPSGKHWFGTDRAGQDLFSRVTEGARLSLTIGFFAALFATGLGTIIGLLSGFIGGTTDLLFNRIMDALQAFPPIVFLLLMRSVVEDKDNLILLVLILGVLGVAGAQRIARGSVIAASQEQYVEAARTIGAGSTRIMFRHVLPNIFAPIIVVFSISIGLYILAEATISFLGLGPTQVSWGKMVSDGRQFIISGGSPWTSLFAGLAITTLVFGFNVAGDALRDVLDPRLRGT